MSDPMTVPATGTIMTDIGLLGPDGTPSTLERERGDERAVVFFMRAATCAICLGHARSILKMGEAGELKGARFLLIVPGDAREARTAQQRIGSPNVAVWASGENHAAVGLGKFLMMQHSGTFVLDRDGRVLFTKTSAIPTASFSRADVARVLGH